MDVFTINTMSIRNLLWILQAVYLYITKQFPFSDITDLVIVLF